MLGIGELGAHGVDDAVLDFFEGLLPAGLAGEQFDDVIAELRSNRRFSILARFERITSVLKFRHHSAARKESKIAIIIFC